MASCVSRPPPGFKSTTEVKPLNFAWPAEYQKHLVTDRWKQQAIGVATDKCTSFVHEDMRVVAMSNKHVSVYAAGWLLNFTRRLLFKPLPDSKTSNYLDSTRCHLRFTAKQAPIQGTTEGSISHLTATRFACSSHDFVWRSLCRAVTMRPIAASSEVAHGIIGQSFAFKGQVNGKLDNYTAQEVTTNAQAEGAIEGVFTEYELAEPYDTHFKYEKFDAVGARPASSAPALTASTETSEATMVENA